MKPALTLPEVCALLRSGRTSVTRAINSGQLVASKVSGKWLITEDALADYLNATSTRPRKRRARAA